jgi:Mrp family chromosome partitioning ATPase
MQSSASTRSGSNLPLSQRAQRHWREGVIATNLAIALYIAVAPHVDFTWAGMVIAVSAGISAGIAWILARSVLSSGDDAETEIWVIDRSDPAPSRQSRSSMNALPVTLRESHPLVRGALRAAPTPANMPPPSHKSPAPRSPLDARRSSVPPAPVPVGEPSRASQPARMEEAASRRMSSAPLAGRRSSLPLPPLHVVTANLATAPNLVNGASVLHPALLTNVHVLRTELFMLAAQECFVIGISSDAARKALKSEFAAQLAVALAQPGQARVLLVEADATTPAIERSLTVEIPRAVSFSQQLLRRASEADRSWAVLRIAPGVDVLAEGRIRTPGMLHAPAFSSAISDLRRHYDVIVADGPVIGSGDGARAFEAVTDGVAFLTTGEGSAREPRERAYMQFHTKRLFKLLSAH